MTTQRFWTTFVLFAGVSAIGAAASAAPLSTSFTYQGQLTQNGNPVNGSADFRFELFDADTGGVQAGSTVIVSNVAVSDGVYSVELDFGVDVFNGDARWLEMSVRTPHDPNDITLYTTLNPRQKITATPYALQTRGMFTDSDGNVFVGSAVPNNLSLRGFTVPSLSSGSTSTDGIGVLGEATALTGPATGVKGVSASTEGVGIVGEASAGTGLTVGVRGTSASTSGIGVVGEGEKGVTGTSSSTTGEGVRGEVTATTGANAGVCGVTASDGGSGVVGEASSATGDTAGVKGTSMSSTGTGVLGEGEKGVTGMSDSTTGEGVRGEVTATTGANAGVCGVTASDGGSGVVGEASSATGDTAGVKGKSMSSTGTGVLGEGEKGVTGMSSSTTGEGVRGEVTATTGANAGVCGVSASSSGAGVVGEASSATGDTAGVMGISMSTDGTGVVGSGTKGIAGISAATNGAGVVGEATSSSGNTAGVMGTSLSTSGAGVVGEATATSGTACGVMGKSHASGGVGLYGEADVNSAVAVRGVAISPSSGQTYGVHGVSQSGDEVAAGVLAEGAGVHSPGVPAAAALEINNGAVRVSGDSRPAGTILVSGSEQDVTDCGGDKIGERIDIDFQHDLLLPDSIVLLSVSASTGAGNGALTATLINRGSGTEKIRVTAIGTSGCNFPGGSIYVHYFIINPAGS